ncbi:hypothetical protein CU098_012712 [Rhizopus stolonifer]|uniref:Endonuclease/exonuclease/phosphatase domain-containing protein n=1 Tax=Rhizopus stolonifer TaxID=4846 RepID=A0A367KQD7_RHIST|nr:hypothetical protein CU098_012712 [Rhizopus stolonifer]
MQVTKTISVEYLPLENTLTANTLKLSGSKIVLEEMLFHPADARIVRLKLERHPYLPFRLLKADMESQLSRFGQILDLGVTTVKGCFTGQGYATLNLSPSGDKDTQFEPLQRVILPTEDGHRMRQCPRNNAIDTVTALSKKWIVNKERKVPRPTVVQEVKQTTPSLEDQAKETVMEKESELMIETDEEPSAEPAKVKDIVMNEVEELDTPREKKTKRGNGLSYERYRGYPATKNQLTEFACRLRSICIDPSGRYVLAEVCSTDTMIEKINRLLPILSILNIYAPATGSARIKEQFFHSVLNDSTLHQYLHSELYSTVILEDFNYRCDVRTMDDIVRGPPPTWSSLLDLQYHDCFKDEKQTTFKRGDLRSIIDYIFCCNRLRFSINQTEQLYLSPEWTDHAMLSVTFNLTVESTKGPGAWKADPFLARRKKFRQQLAE